jgi:peptidoglycan hydrolase FlgJ
MGGIDRIGRVSPMTRDNPSEGLEAREKAEARHNQPARNEKVDEVAKLYEKQFLREMVRAMRGTVSFGAQKPSMAENIYREQLDNEYVESWGEQGGIGLSELIYEQLMDRYFAGGPGAKLKQQGPIAISDKDIARVSRVATSASSGVAGQVPLRVEMKPADDGSPARLQAPWSATVLSKSLLDGKTSLTLGHPGGLKSTLIFQGVAGGDLEPGQQIERGKTLGILSPDVDSFFWNISQSMTRAGSEAGVGTGPDAGRVTGIVSAEREDSRERMSDAVKTALGPDERLQKD